MKKLFAFLAVFAMCFSYAQDGINDPSFNPSNNLGGSYLLAIDSNNNLYVSEGTNLRRLSPLGVPNGLNLTFNNTVTKVYIQSNGNILIGGYFTNYFGKNKLVRVSPTGAVDLNFSPVIPEVQTMPTDIEVQNDGTVLLTGSISGGITTTTLTRFNGTTGSLITSGITTPTQFINRIDDVTILPNNNLAIGGCFSQYAGQQRKSIAILQSNGALTSVNITNFYAVTRIAAVANNQIVVAGINATGSTPLLRRFNSTTGAIDLSFSPIISGTNINDMVVQSDGKIIITGEFSAVNGVTRRGLARLNTNGTLDLCYAEDGIDNDGAIYSCKLDSNGDLYFSGVFSAFDSTPRNDFAKAYSTAQNVVANDDINMPSTNNVLSNDTYNGGTATTSNVVLSQLSTSNSNVTLITSGANAGKINVVSGTPSGTYTLNYRICGSGTLNCHCDDAVATIVYTAAPSVIVNDDVVNINVCSSTTINVLTNDTVNGSPATLQSVSLTRLTVPQGTITFSSSTGNVTIPGNLAPGQYNFIYQACYQPDGVPCRSGSVIIIVAGTVNANNDSATFYSGTGGNINILANDNYSNCLAATTENTNVSIISTPLSGITLVDGVINVASSVPAGNYSITYQICSNNYYANLCDTATVTINVYGNLVANTDDFSQLCVNGLIGGLSGDVTANDTMNGQPLNDNFVTITLINNGGITNATINNTGLIAIPEGTPVGTYTLTYRICQINTSNCITASVKICINNVLNPGSGPNNLIYDIKIQPNGYILIGGIFTAYNGTPRNRIARLKPDLSLDTSFDPTGIGFDGAVHTIELQDNKILIGGKFMYTTNGVFRRHFARLNSNGTLDTSVPNINFGNSSDTNEGVFKIRLQTDGTIMVGGRFNSTNSIVGAKNLIRLTSNCGISPNFQSPFSGSGTVLDIYTYSDGKMLIAGGWLLQTDPNGPFRRLIRINSLGIVDATFALGTSAFDNEWIQSILIHYDKIIVGGAFDNLNGVHCSNIAQLDVNGNVESVSSNNTINGYVYSLIHDANNKILVGGSFSSFNGNSSNGLLRLNSNGIFDPTLIVGSGFNGNVYALAVQNNGKIVVGGSFDSYNGNITKFLTRIDPTTNPATQSRFMAPMYEEKNILIYPNPSNGSFNIDLSGYEDTIFDIIIHNPLGQIIYKGKIAQGSSKVDLNSIESGNYFITMQSNIQTINKVIAVKK